MVSGVLAATASASSGAPSAVFVVGVIVAVVTSLRASRAYRNASFRLADSMAFSASFSRARLIRCARKLRIDFRFFGFSNGNQTPQTADAQSDAGDR